MEREPSTALQPDRLLETAPEASLDRIAALAADLFDAPIALVSLLDDQRQWFKARSGLEVISTPREHAFCTHALELEPHAVMVVEDATADPRFRDNPLVVGAPHIRFYAAALLSDGEGRDLGTLCVIDTMARPRPSNRELGRLQSLAGMVVHELERLRANRLVAEQRRVLSLAEATSGVGHWRFEVRTGRVAWSDEVYRIHGVTREAYDPNIEDAVDFYLEADRPVLKEAMEQAVSERSGYELTLRIRRADGALRDLLSKARCELDEFGEVSALFGVCQDVTEQKTALRTVQSSEARYRLLADHAADVIARIRLDRGGGYISPSVKALLGYEPEEMADLAIEALVHAADQSLVLRMIAALSAGQEERTVQARALHRDGYLIWTEVRARLVRDEAGRPYELVAVIRDISERKALEREMITARDEAQEQARRAAMAERIAGLGYWRLDLKDSRIFWSAPMYAHYGLPPGATLELDTLMAQTHPDDAKQNIAKFRAAVAGECSCDSYLTRVYGADGVLRYLRANMDVERNAEGQVCAVIGTVMNVTAQRLANMAVEESEARYRLLAESAHDVILHSDVDGRLTYISPSIEATTGYRPEDLIGRMAFDLVHADDSGRIAAELEVQRLNRGSRPATRVEYRARCKDGREIWVECRPTVVFDPQTGKVDGFTDVVRDITERKTLEAELRSAREVAESAAAVKSDFLANMSHELRTPLTSILGFTSLVAAQPGLSDKGREYINRVEDAGRALLCTVNDVLDFSKLEAGQLMTKPMPTNLPQLCRATLDLFAPQAATKRLQLHLDLGRCPDSAVAIDPDRVRQILLNLVGNAVKFTSRGAVTLAVAYDQTQERVTISVHDTGPGIAPDKVHKLFQRFSQIDGSLTRVHGGTGLGLAICKGLVEAMGGEIGADTVPDQGSRFWFALPAPFSEPEASPSREPELLEHSIAGIRLLVADDHPTNRELVRLFLTGVEAEVTEAVDGASAVDLAGQRSFDVILMDVRMPVLDGPSAMQRIRSGTGPNRATPILAYTADAATEEAVRLRALGFEDVVAKPVKAAALIAAIARAAALGVGGSDGAHVVSTGVKPQASAG